MLICFAFFGVANAQQSLPYSYGFEDNDLSTDGWIANVTSSSSGINSASAYSGSYGFRFNYSEQSGSLISPVLTGGDLGVDVSFWYKEYSSSYGDEQFYVGYTTDANTTDVDAFTYGTIVTASTSWQEYTNSFPAGTKRIAIKYVYNDAFYLYLDDFSFEAVSDCPKPKDLDVTLGDGTASATWTSDATSFNIDINGTVTNNVTNPYTFDTEMSTAYTVKVQANCEGGETSDWSDAYTFTTPTCIPSTMCSITLALTDSFGDGWNGGKMEVVDANTSEVYGTYTIASGSSANYELALCPGTVVNFVYTAGSYGTENGWTIYDAAGEVITEEAGCDSGCTHTNGIQATYTMECPTCIKPSNLQATNIGTESADLSWTGTSDSYMLQYRSWMAAGDNVTPTGTMTPYTFDLSQYSGTGSVAIRHYEVTNMFRLIVDDIQVTNAAGTVVYSQDFEDCGGVMPSEFSLMDMDGDGYNWEVVDNSQSYVNDTYGISSASWISAGALTPDNWIILSGIELGGSITFSARCQDPSFAAETFCVYVCPDNALVEIPVNGTTYAATGLVPHSVIAWQVKGICGDEETNYVSAMFQTLDDVLVFATEGTWDNLTNWTDALGNAATALPTINDKVQINADVTIPNGVVAYAKQANLNVVKITIDYGGQLKMDATAVVTIEKVIEGYGESDGYYYFIASPLTTTRLTYMPDWSYVNALTGDYDLYTFDAAAEDGMEWINYKSSSDHANFTSGSNNPVFVPGNGYLYANKTTTPLQFEGNTALKSYNNVQTKEFNFNTASTDEFNGCELVGNPFTCNAYISYVDDAGVALEADFYTLNTNNTYTLMTSSDALAPCTGAIVSYSATGKVQFSSEAPATGKASMLNMTVTEGRNKVDQARVRFGEGHNLKHMSFRNSSKLYMPVDGNDYAVVYAEAQGEMPVNFKAENNGTYTINFNTEEVSFSYLHLIDNLTGNDVDLLANPSYTFDANTSDYSSRFKLVFATGENSSEFAFVSNNNLIVNGEGTLRVIDMTGRVIATEEINGVSSIKLNAAAGVYVLQLNDKTQKIVIK